MENSPYLEETLKIKPIIVTSLGNPSRCEMRRAFWGNFPQLGLIAKSKRKPMRFRKEVNRESYTKSAERAKIPLPCSLAFARACKEELERRELEKAEEKSVGSLPTETEDSLLLLPYYLKREIERE